MRLNENEINVLTDLSKSFFGEKAKLILFGSRTDDTQKGGDIDVLLIPNNEMNNAQLFRNKLKYLVAVKEKIGDQKIDVVIPELSSKSIVDTALRTGTTLC